MDAARSSPCAPDGRREAPDGGVDGTGEAARTILLARGAKGDVVHGVDPALQALGIAPGQRATDVMALHPGLAVAHADPAAEAAALARLAAWMRRWSPLTRTDGVDGVALDATGCAHLFGGETAMLRGMGERLASLGVTARLAIAPNHAAAHALARYGTTDAPTIVDDTAVRDAVAPLPVEALRIDPSSVAVLRRLGLKTIGQLAALPRPALKKRFGTARRRDPRDDTWDDYLGRSLDRSADVLVRLDEALGRVAVPLDPTREREPPRIARGLTEAVMETDTVLASTRPLLEELGALLEARGEGMRALRLEAFRTDGGRSETVLHLSRPTRDADHLMRLLVDRLEGWRAEFGYDALAVEAIVTERVVPAQDDAEITADGPDPHALVDRLRARLGRDAVLRAVPRESHWPERAEAWLPAGETSLGRMGRMKELILSGADGPVQWSDAGAPAPPRPDRLLDPPEPVSVIHAVPDGPPARFTWRRVTHDVDRASGPERIAPEWWRERSTARARDYWRVETHEGRRLWFFREGFEDDEREAPPRWFVHGLFS